MPVKSLTNSSQLIADYLAGKIEQSYPIQSLFQEILLMFQQEAVCVGPGFQNDNNSDRAPLNRKNVAGANRRSLTSSPTNDFNRKSSALNDKDQRGRGNSVSEVDSNDQNYTKDLNNSSYAQDKNQADMPIVEGFRIMCSGRLQMSPRSKPAEKAESVVITRGVLPFNTFDQNIDFKQTYATNAYGTIGIKV